MSILVRIVGGIVGRGAKTVAPINRNMSTGSVKPGNPKGMQSAYNQSSEGLATVRKSGKLAKDIAKEIEKENLQGIVSGKTGNPKIFKIKSGK